MAESTLPIGPRILSAIRRYITVGTLVQGRRRLDVRSRFVVASTHVALVVGLALSLLPLGCAGVVVTQRILEGQGPSLNFSELWQGALFCIVLGPFFSWIVLMPLAGRLAAGLESVVVPIYRAILWKPERFEEIYSRPLPRSGASGKSRPKRRNIHEE
jgi:hypothetical protein